MGILSHTANWAIILLSSDDASELSKKITKIENEHNISKSFVIAPSLINAEEDMSYLSKCLGLLKHCDLVITDDHYQEYKVNNSIISIATIFGKNIIIL